MEMIIQGIISFLLKQSAREGLLMGMDYRGAPAKAVPKGGDAIA